MFEWKNYIENQQNTGEYRLPGRSLLLPAQKSGVTHWNYTDSDRIVSLNGDWQFKYLSEAPQTEEALAEALNGGEWDILPVPSMWQYHGYGKCVYPNVCYPFPFDPPHIDIENPVGFYRRHFDFPERTESDGRTLLRFTGGGSAYFTWINGQYIGFGKESRIASEFDVTGAVREGDNEITVLVFTWSDGSYLENQDMLLASGLFRDLYLVREGVVSLWDYTVVPTPDGFRIDPVLNGENGALRLSLSDAEGKPISEAEWNGENGASVFLPVAEPRHWNAEDPYLYTLTLTVLSGDRICEIHTKKIGLRFSEIVGNRLLLNGKPITVKGVNRHDNNPKEGQAVTKEQIRAELLDIKDCNLNAIRTSHYTQQPVFYELASEIGLYIMDEADCESHGAHVTGDEGYLNKQPDWFVPMFDRVSRSYLQDKNETCVHLRSPGNECGCGPNWDACADWLLAQKGAVPVHFPPFSEQAGEVTGFRMTGYMTMQTLKDFEEEGKPVIMTEYAHAMGNSPGALEDIWRFVYSHPYLCGGYVWEYKSHGFYEKGRNGKPRYLYGGDFGEFYHWSNFSLDGYHTSDGTPKPAWRELQTVSAPVQFERTADGILVRNTYDFTSLEGVRLVWTVSEDGIPVTSGLFRLGPVLPHTVERLPLSPETDRCSGLVTLELTAISGHSETILGQTQFLLKKQAARKRETRPFAHTLKKNGSRITLEAGSFLYEFHNGLLVRFCKNGIDTLTGPVQVNLWRAPTDNDGIVGLFPRHLGEWQDRLVQTASFRVSRVEVGDSPDAVTVTAFGKTVPTGLYWGFDTVLTYTLTDSGLNLRMTGTPYGIGPSDVLPRIGLVFPLTSGFERVTWLGRSESYPDRKASAMLSLFDSAVADLNFAYDVPQETGNHEDTSYVTVYGPGGTSLTVSQDEQAPRFFSFSLHDFTLQNLTSARHCDELAKTAEKYLYIDGAMRGLGSLSCGPEPEKEYELTACPFDYSFTVR